MSVSGIADERPPIVINVNQPSEHELLRTLEQVRQLREDGARDPVTIVLHPGIYQLSQTLALTPAIVGQGLTLKAEAPDTVVVTGAAVLANPNREPQGNWRFSVPGAPETLERPRAVLIDGRLQTAARFPSTGYLRVERALEDRRSGFVANFRDLPEHLLLQPDNCDLILLHDWSSSRLPVASFDQQSRVLRTLGPIGCEAPHYAIDHFETQPRYWLEGHPDFARQPGDWFYDSDTHEIVIIADPETQHPPIVAMPLVTELVTAIGDNQPVVGLHLQNITFTGSQFPMPAGGFAGAQASMHEPRDAAGKRSTSHRPIMTAAVMLEHAKHCRITGCRFENIGTTALWIGRQTSHIKVFRCRIQHVAANGINIGEDNSRTVEGKAWYLAAPDQVPAHHSIRECRISQCGRILPGAVAIWAALNQQLEVAENHIHDCPYTGISLGWIWNDSITPAAENRIHGNRIEFVMQVLSDGAGIYTLGRQPDTIIENNIITDIPLNAGRAESNGVFLDEGSTGFTVRSNTIRRIDKSPVRFHKAGTNTVRDNQWELATPMTPPVRFNNTPEANIAIRDNQILPPQTSVLMIGNSLTWDTRPPLLDGNVHWHVDCGKSLTWIRTNPTNPCVKTSRLWPTAMDTTRYNFVCVQPHYGTTLEEDVAVISAWVVRQQEAVFVIHTGWAKHEFFAEERADDDSAGPMTHSDAYFDDLLATLRAKFPDRQFRSTRAMNLLFQIADDIEQAKSPFQQLTDLYRDAIHLKTDTGRYLMHNAVRQSLGQPLTDEGFPEIAPEFRNYLDQLLQNSGSIKPN